MIGTNQYNLTWDHFNKIHTDKKRSFENLCRSLFARELCQEGIILHSDSNHPGVEVVPVLAKGGKSRISFQAKHFDNSIDYKQITKSINEVVKCYVDKLDVVYLYCNKDINTNSDSYKKIEKILSDVRIRIILITGQTILDQAMSYPSILSCYFGLDSLDDKWFQKNIELSLHNLGRRYNSLFNIDTAVKSIFSIFLREDIGIKRINAKKNNLIDELKNLYWNCDGKYVPEVEAFIKWGKSLCDVDATTLPQALEWKYSFENNCKEELSKLKNKLYTIQEEMKKCSYSNIKYENLKKEKYLVEQIMSVSSYIELSMEEINMINCKVVIIKGEMGTGKSQLLATSAKKLIDSSRTALLFLGQTFISDGSIEDQIMKNLEGLSPTQNFESLIAVMDEKGKLASEYAVIFIDAINESKNRDIWKNGINRVISTLERYNNVKLVISLREGFEELTLSQSVLDKIKSCDIATISHTGFANESPTKIYEFLSNCGIPFSPEYYLNSEMTNPLFLTWFCNTYSGEESGLLTLIESVLTQADQEGSKGAGLSETVGMLKQLICEMLDASENGNLTKQTLLCLPTWNTYGVVNKIGYLNAIERAGVLTSFVREQEEIYYIGYNLLEDYLKADRIVSRENNKEKIIEYCEKTLLGIDDGGKITKSGKGSIFAMVVSLYAWKHGEELIELIDKVKDEYDRISLLDNYYFSFIWRSSHVTYDSFLEIIRKYPANRETVWRVFLENSVKERSELNALGLTKLLNRYPLNRRDLLWTMVINDFNEDNRIINLVYYIESGNTLQGLTDKKVYLLLVTYAWMLSSSNRNIRDRVSKAMIEILKEHFTVCKCLLDLFKDVNDPYIIQRLYGIVFGAVMKRKSKYKLEFKDLAEWIYTEIFDKELVCPDILLRDYARLIVERFAIEYPNDLENINLEKIKPPYNSEPIPVAKKVDYSEEKLINSSMEPLLFSMKFNCDIKGVGLYGDFGRYVFQSALEYFMDVDIANIYYYAMQYILYDLGYNADYFGKYDSSRYSLRYNVKKIERIGKKYQWIAMYNILARISDTHNVKGLGWNDKIGITYEGPWYPYVRDFDPTLNIKAKGKSSLPKIILPSYSEDSFCDEDALEDDIEKWLLEDDKMFKDFPERFILSDEFGKKWLSLYIHQENKFMTEREKYSSSGFNKGEQHIWTIATMYIIPRGEPICNEKKLIESRFIQHSNGIQSYYSLFSREYAWSPGYKAEFRNTEYGNGGDDISAFPATINFLWEEEYDASQEESTSFAIPAGEVIREMQLYEKERDGVYYKNEEIVAFDLALTGNEYSELIIRKDILDKYIQKAKVQIFWTVIGEKQYFLGSWNQKWQRREGYFVYKDNSINGSIWNVDDI